MKITSVNNNRNFGKTALLNCNVKEKESQNKNSATLYQMDINNYNDIQEILYSKNTKVLHNDLKYYRDKLSGYNFYILQNDNTQEVISCAETSHNYLTTKEEISKNSKDYDCDNPYKLNVLGTGIIIQELSENKKYINGSEPIIGYLAKTADENEDISISTAFRTEEFDLKNSRFTKSENDNWTLPNKRFQTVANQAEERYQIEYLV